MSQNLQQINNVLFLYSLWLIGNHMFPRKPRNMSDIFKVKNEVRNSTFGKKIIKGEDISACTISWQQGLICLIQLYLHYKSKNFAPYWLHIDRTAATILWSLRLVQKSDEAGSASVSESHCLHETNSKVFWVKLNISWTKYTLLFRHGACVRRVASWVEWGCVVGAGILAPPANRSVPGADVSVAKWA